MSLLTNTGFPTYSYAPTTVAGHGTGVRNAQIYGRGYIPALRAEGQMLEERVKLHREMMTAQACEPQVPPRIHHILSLAHLALRHCWVYPHPPQLPHL